MPTRDINCEIIEELYSQALVLADDARTVFDLRRTDAAVQPDDLTRVALSIEGLRTTTRLMHVLAWLLNQRAYRSGELSAGQLARSGRLPDEPPADVDNLALLEPATRALIEEGEALHARVARLDREWRANAGEPPVEELRGRITAAFARG